MKNFILLFLCTLIFSSSSSAQQTGDFSIGFPSPDTLLTRDSVYVYFHVPQNYNAANAHKLIVGNHGLGDPDTSIQIRNYLAPVGDSLNAIIMCADPYLQDQPRSRLVINIALDSVMNWYNIDTNEIYIIGYSAGSDVAAQYVLDNPLHQMKGLIWFAPGFFYQPPLSSFTTFPPTCLCVGDVDFISTFLNQVQAIRDSFAGTTFDFYFNLIPGVGHTMNFPTFPDEILECIRFIDDPENFSTHIISEEEGTRLSIRSNSQKIIVDLTLKEPGKFEIALYDMNGKQVKSSARNIHLTPGDNKFSFSTKEFTSGVYLLNIKSSKTNYTGKVMIF